MTEKEIVKLFALIRSEYSNFEKTDEKQVLWYELMINLPFEKAVENAKKHMSECSFPPTAANIIRHEPEVFADYDRIKLDTQTYLQQREEWQRKAIECPPHLSRKHLTQGGSDTDE